MTDFEGLLRRLADHGVEFVLVGGVAATVHGSTRLTQDLDLVHDRSPANLERLATALADLSPYPRGAPPGLPFGWSADTLRAGLNFTLTTTLGDIDLLGEIPGGGYADLAVDAVPIALFGVEIRCLSLDRLIETKRAAGRPRDFETIAELEVIREEREAGSPSGSDHPRD